MGALMRSSTFNAPRCVLTGYTSRGLTPLTHCKRWRSADSQASDQTAATAALSSRWLSDVKARIGICITFGMRPHQTVRAGQILQEIARDWRELVAGSEGFLTGPQRRGMYRQEVVWGEMDSMGHVNNVAYNRYAESGRVQWAHKYAHFIDPAHQQEWLALAGNTGDGMILRKITTEFKFPMTWPDRISVYHKLRTEPTSDTDSFILDVLIMSEVHQRPAARCVEDIVMYDYRAAKKTRLKPFMLDVLKETWRLQEESKKENSQRVMRLLSAVRGLEEETWDRADAVEDMGGVSER